MRIIHPGQVATNRIVPNAGSGPVIAVAQGGGSAGGSPGLELLINGGFAANAANWLVTLASLAWQAGVAPNEGQGVLQAQQDAPGPNCYQNGNHPIAGANCRLLLTARSLSSPVKGRVLRGDNFQQIAETPIIAASGVFSTVSVDFVMPLDAFRVSAYMTAPTTGHLVFIDKISLLLL